MKSQKNRARIFSFEFFPPKTEDAIATLRDCTDQLVKLKPGFFSVTFGAGGSTRSGTYETVRELAGRLGVEAAPHISCIASTRVELREILQSYKELDVRHIVALRGDPPSGLSTSGELRYAADLVSFIRAETGEQFHIDVAAYPEFHPEARSANDDLASFKRKIDAGANSAITQYFYNADAYFRFVDACEVMRIDVPIVPGIMPITNFKQLTRFSENCGAEIPRWISKRLEGFGDDLPSIRAFGLDVVVELCQNLLEGGAPGLHFYTLNRAHSTCMIWKRLGLDKE